MVNESTDIENKEKLVLCFAANLEVYEVHRSVPYIKYICWHNCSSYQGYTDKNEFEFEQCRGQCYDGAGAMAGAHKGISTQICSEEPRALFTHCYGHAMNLAICNTMKKCKVVQDATFEILSKLIKYSPKHDAIFTKLTSELSPGTPGFRVLCPTRWSVRGDSLFSVMDNYTVLQHTWEECLESRLDAEVKSWIIGVKAQMETFYFFLVYVSWDIEDNLYKTLQSSSISAAGG